MSPTSHLWASTDLSQWHTALDSYSSHISRLSTETPRRKDLVQLDEWFRLELPKSIQERGESRHLKKDEIVGVVKWKITRGKSRPLLRFAEALDEKEVEEVTTKSIHLLLSGDEKGVLSALETLTTLKGIGPATASAILSAVTEACPFMSDEAILSVPGLVAPKGKISYDLKTFGKFEEEIRGKCEDLNGLEGEGTEAGSFKWTPSAIERGLWASSFSQPSNANDVTASSSKNNGGKAKTSKKREIEEVHETDTNREGEDEAGDGSRRKSKRRRKG